jgi:integrase
LESIPKDSVSGLRDLALIAAMFYSFARVSAVLKLKVDDYYHNGARRRLRLRAKGGKEHEMPVPHLLEQILNEYIEAAGLRSGQPLFQSLNLTGTAVTGRALNRYNAWAAILKRAKAAGFLTPVGCHTWLATIYLENDGRLEHAQQMARHESPRTTKLYDRTKDYVMSQMRGSRIHSSQVTLIARSRGTAPAPANRHHSFHDQPRSRR